VPGLTCIVLTLNEARNIEGCLEGLRFADDVLVVDSGSSDGTAELAARWGARVLHHAHRTFSEQRTWAMEQAAQQWIVMVDADERIGPDLAREIREVVATGACDGYEVKRENYFLGRRIRHSGWQHDWVLRVFRKGKASYGRRYVHERAAVQGRVGRLRARLVHHPYRTLDDYWLKLRRYANWSAQEARAKGRRISALAMVLHPPLRFLRCYLFQWGFLDGRPGLVLSLLTAIYASVKDVYVWQMEETAGAPPAEAEVKQ